NREPRPCPANTSPIMSALAATWPAHREFAMAIGLDVHFEDRRPDRRCATENSACLAIAPHQSSSKPRSKILILIAALLIQAVALNHAISLSSTLRSWKSASAINLNPAV